MRPVERGAVPLDNNGNAKRFRKYQDARADLIDRMGEYCSYCEMHLDASLAVEHVLPKSRHPARELRWDNFLLGCTNCNSTKGDKPIRLDEYFWPDRDNTTRAFDYGPSALIQGSLSLTIRQRTRAENLLRLTGLDKIPTNDPAASDRRWINRHDAWDKAQRAKLRLRQQDTEQMRQQIVDTASAKGYWSVWMTVFADDVDMRRRLIAGFPGTCTDCFRDDTSPRRCAGGSL